MDRQLRDQILRHADAIRAAGVTALYVFGSQARGDARSDSDLDAFIDIDASRKFSLLDLVGLELFLERELKMPVDLITRNSLNPLIRGKVEAEAVRVV